MRNLLIALSFLMLGACSKVPAGHVGVKVFLLGGEKGVDSQELGVGRYWIGINEELYLFPTFQQNYVWTKTSTEGSPNDESFTFQTNEGLEVGADIGISYHLDPTKISGIYQKYRRGINEITDVFLRNHVRDALNSQASMLPVASVYGSGKTALITDVSSQVTREVSEIGIVVDKIYLIGSLRLPLTVTKALNAKIEATQKTQQRENEVAQSKAEADKKIETATGKAKSIALIAQAEADANKLVSQSITPELVEYERVKKWDGKMPQVTAGSSGGILLNVNRK